jgi:hypothetical protein
MGAISQVQPAGPMPPGMISSLIQNKNILNYLIFSLIFTLINQHITIQKKKVSDNLLLITIFLSDIYLYYFLLLFAF